MEPNNNENQPNEQNKTTEPQGILRHTKEKKPRIKDNKYNIIGESVTIGIGLIGFLILLYFKYIPLSLLVFGISLLLARFAGFALRNHFEKHNSQTKDSNQ